ncbi:hypothetical protein Y1Q_0023870 [Alligator mississippiensis]|uniref:Uncharacterized protein n=1 Tax=Alligator mississippiensis TaxID=8496 RepID=A0A151MKQ3_ALLMI|nr:hypothetical protein Y1Q_0023870 [Alligator mississippiensis]
MRADQPARAGGEGNASSPAAWTSSGRDADVIRVRCRPRRRVTRHASGLCLGSRDLPVLEAKARPTLMRCLETRGSSSSYKGGK